MTDVYGTQKNVVVELSRDDLAKIKGIGTTTAEKLYNAKIVTVRQIAEMTPERLSETPGIGLATATKFIIAAKNYLDSSQEENIGNNTPQIQEAVEIESVTTQVEKYEVEELIVEETQNSFEELQAEEDFSASEPKAIQLPKIVDYGEQLEVEQVIEYEEEEEEIVEYEEEPSQEIKEISRAMLTEQNQPEQQKGVEEERIEVTATKPINVDVGLSRDRIFEIREAFKDLGCYEIPGSLESLRQFTKNLDYLGCKLVEASNNLKILFLFLVKRFEGSGTVLVEETKIELKAYRNNEDSRAFNDVKQITHNLLRVRNNIQEDVANDTTILQFFQKYLQLELRSEKSFGNKNLVFLSGSTQYKVVIEPILVCNAPPKSMEKSLAFPYQRTSNLHAVDRTDIPPLVKFLEKKYKMIEKRTKKKSSIKDYHKSQVELNSRVRYVSIPIFGYAVALLVIYFAKMYFLLRLFNTVGFAVLGIYLSLLAFLYFRAYKTKKEFVVQVKTPYYQQTFEFNETDLLDFKEELTDKLMAQFGYECLGKEASFGVIEQVEVKSLKNSIDTKQSEPEFKNMFETEQVKAKSVNVSTTKYNGKYSSFLDDP